MILPYLSLDSLSSLYSIGITMILCRSMTDACNNNFETDCGVVSPSRLILRQPLAIGDWGVWGWQTIKWYNTLLTC